MEKHHPGPVLSSTELRTKQGIKLEPQPQGAEDPLTWPITKKITTLAIISFCAFVGQAQAQASTAGIAVQLLLAGHRTISSCPVLHKPFDALLIGLQPITIICGLFSMITFGWAVATAVLVPVFLQTPTSEDGYGFSPISNACFSFVTWITALLG
ncbi:hypothetical protein M409DRAFT_54517 [Zasmidium cellare ATCC 36951]|uniref:Uncharacterized protein n=1 Tax=Zasmidium cellare ATCC 36951 TaxID=1080233 RepID=A0A6A6CHP5_ZASCE|nr:uncharacterized protein M409DRAFT_54517 [Zasmidium cellare ATCC 36951]KAF2166724.1 hypothetical protein M409DRAFT_54517 [Zasmidium cellare ATCC 36951]